MRDINTELGFPKQMGILWLRYGQYLCLCLSLLINLQISGQVVQEKKETQRVVASANEADINDASTTDAYTLISAAIDQTRGLSSYVELRMLIHRPDWERSSQLKSWTKGRANALVRFVAPAKDAGNATLKVAEKVWTYTPRINRIIRLPYSLMSQSWAGSDFSYNDLSRTDNLLHEYELRIVNTEVLEGHSVYTVVAVPHENAPVVWGKEELVIRDDYVLLKQTFFDQDMVAYKRMETLEIAELGGRVFGIRMRMYKVEEPNRWTELEYLAAEFDLELKDRLFTQFSLKSGI